MFGIWYFLFLLLSFDTISIYYYIDLLLVTVSQGSQKLHSKTKDYSSSESLEALLICEKSIMEISKMISQGQLREINIIRGLYR